jgi:hypothetical protein
MADKGQEPRKNLKPRNTRMDAKKKKVSDLDSPGRRPFANFAVPNLFLFRGSG